MRNVIYLFTVQPVVTEFFLQDAYYSESNHSFSCKATFDDNTNVSLEIQQCNENSYETLTDDSDFAVIETLDNGIAGNCTHQISIVYSFNFTTASNGTLLRCLAVDNTLKLNATVECLRLVLQRPGKHFILTVKSSFDNVITNTAIDVQPQRPPLNQLLTQMTDPTKY